MYPLTARARYIGLAEAWVEGTCTCVRIAILFLNLVRHVLYNTVQHARRSGSLGANIGLKAKRAEMVPCRRPNSRNKSPPVAGFGSHLARFQVQHAHTTEQVIASGRREDDDPAGGDVTSVFKDAGEVGGEGLHDARAVDNSLGDGDALRVGECRIREGFGDDVSTGLADQEEHRGLGRAIRVPLGVVGEDVGGKCSTVSGVAAEDLQGGTLWHRSEGAGRCRTDTVDGDVLKVRPVGGVGIIRSFSV